MNEKEFRIERILHAYVDNELDLSDRRHALLRIETDDAVRQQVCELQRTKEWVRFAFAGERAPTRTLPDTPGRQRLRVAASVLLLVAVFASGWMGRAFVDRVPMLAGNAVQEAGERHVILHIGESDETRFAALLAKAGQMLERYAASGIQVEVVTNAGGLDLVRKASSKHTEEIRRMIRRFDNVRFIACSKGLERLRKQGEDVKLIDGVLSEEPAADHLIQRLTQGWTLVKI